MLSLPLLLLLVALFANRVLLSEPRHFDRPDAQRLLGAAAEQKLATVAGECETLEIGRIGR